MRAKWEEAHEEVEAQKEEDEGKVQVDCPHLAPLPLEPAKTQNSEKLATQLLRDVLQQDGACRYCLSVYKHLFAQDNSLGELLPVQQQSLYCGDMTFHWTLTQKIENSLPSTEVF